MMKNTASPNAASRTARARSARLPLLLAAAALAATMGCSVFNRPAPGGALFMLAPTAPAAQQGASLGTVLVRRFTASEPYADRSLLYRTTNGTWRGDAYNGFAADPAEMMTAALFDALEASGRFDLVASEGVTAGFDLEAEGALEQFYADFGGGGGPEAVVRMRVYLVHRNGLVREVATAIPVEARAPIEDDTPGAVVDALSAATSRAFAQVVAALPATPPTSSRNTTEQAQKAQ